MMRHLPLLALAFLLAVFLSPQTQDGEDALITEEDYRVTSVAGRQRAVEDLLGKVAEFRKSGQVIEAARALNRVGRFRIRMSLVQEAVTTFQEALKLLQQQPDIKTQIDSLNGLAFSYGKLSKCELAEPSANQAITLSNQNNYVAGKAEGLLVLSDCQNFRDHALALKTAQESLALWSKIDRKRGMANSHVAIAHYQMTQHNLEECGKSLQAALNILKELADGVGQAEVLIFFGYIEYRNAAWQSSLDYFTQAESLIDKNAEPYKMGQITIGLGDSFLESGMPEVALPKYQESLEYFRITQNPRAMSILKWSIGKANYFAGNYESAIYSLQTARGEAQASGDITLTAFCDDFLGRTYHARNDHAVALNYFQAALDGYSKAKNVREAARVRALMGRVYQQQGSFEKARETYQTARETFGQLADRVNESATLFAMGSLELQENDLDKAAQFLEQSIAFTEKMRRVSSSSDLTAAFSARIYDRYEAYIDCLMRKHAEDPTKQHDVRAFEMSESARGRSLADLLRDTQTNLAPGVDPQLAQQEKLLRQKLRVKENYKVSLLGRAYKQEELEGLDQELAQLSEEYEQVRGQIRQRFPAYDLVTRPTGWSLKDIQEKVIADDQTMLLEYSLGTAKSFVWVVSRNSFASYELPPRDQIVAAVKSVRRYLVNPRTSSGEQDAATATADLSQLVLSSVAPALKGQRIIVIADGALNYIPFQVLLMPGGNVPLIANFEVVTAPSATILGELRQEAAQRQPSKTLAAFGDPVFSSSYAQIKAAETSTTSVGQPSANNYWPSALRDIELNGERFDPSVVNRLFYAKRELANLWEATGGDSLMATEFAATRDKLLTTDLTPYAILHFATHGFLDPKRPERSGLVLSTVDRDGKDLNGFVSLDDIYQLRAPVELVVLSACQTGLGKDVRGEGLLGLTRGFMYAGASSVVASLWKVDDESTAELMKQFYANLLQKGMTPAAALREAQNNIRQRPGWSAPYYWAAFTLQGEYRQVIKQPSAQSNYTRAIIVGALLLLLIVTAGWYLSRRYFTEKK
jgi:CHAT domain-containing protein/Flp pilus assembly protein TadD